MRTTIKLDLTKSLTIEPATSGVRVAIQLGSVTVGSAILDAGKLGAMMFGIEQAAARANIVPERASVL